MEEKVSLNEMNRRWEVLLTRKRQSDELVRPSVVLPSRDPFDCSDCAVPTTFDLVEDAVSQAVEEWRDLDDRKIPESEDPNGNANAAPAQKKPKWYNMHVRLPQSFDYATKNQEPPPDDGGGDRVLQLDNPTVTGSYHQELWRLFRALPTRSELEAEALEGLDTPAMIRLRNELRKLEAKDPRPFFGHLGVFRLRASDRHDAPETAFIPPSHKTRGTIIFEIWKGMIQHLLSYRSPADDRMVLEFLGEQTLADFHRTLVELSDDTFWDDNVAANNDSGIKEERSGMFMIENTIYTYGKVDYSVPIMDWLKQAGTDTDARVRHNLGIDTKDIEVQLMDDVRLEQIPMRLGMRYMHVHSGTVKSQVFLVDRRHGYPRQPTIARNYPVIHDIWVNGWGMSDCEGCKRRGTAVATSLTCEVTDGHRALCQTCADMLQVPSQDRQPYDVWKGSEAN